jgi:hypothetical protein
MKEVGSSETSVNCRTTWSHIPGDTVVHSHRYEDVISIIEIGDSNITAFLLD